jgi:hypothetical protein
VAAGALVWGLSTWAGGSPSAKLEQAVSLSLKPEAEIATRSNNPRIRLNHVFWEAGFGVGVDFPQSAAKGWNQPQEGVFRMGMGGVVLDNVEPSKLGGVAGKLMLLVYGFATVASLHWPARMAGARVSFTQELRLGCVFYFYLALLVSVVAALGTFILVDLAQLKGTSISVSWSVLVVIPMFGIALRCFFASFSELYSVTKKRLFLIGMGSALASAVTAPIVFVPLIYLILRFRDLLEVIV